jgi:hypothetical protein
MSQAEIDDRELAALLAAHALIEIRYLASTADRSPAEVSPEEALRRIRFLADLAHNLPLAAGNRPADGTARWRRGRWAGHGRPAARRDRPGSAAVSSRPVARGHLRPAAHRQQGHPDTHHRPDTCRAGPMAGQNPTRPHSTPPQGTSPQSSGQRNDRRALRGSRAARPRRRRLMVASTPRPGRDPLPVPRPGQLPLARPRRGARVVGVHGAAADGRWRTGQEQPRRAATRSDPGTSQKRPASARIRFGGRRCTARR